MIGRSSDHRQVISRNASGPGVAGAMSCLGTNPGVDSSLGRTAGFADENDSCLQRDQARQGAKAPEPSRPQRQQQSRLAAVPLDAAEPGGICGSAVDADPISLRFGAMGTTTALRLKNIVPFHILFIGLLDAGGSRMFLRTVVTHHFMYGLVAFTDELC